MEWVVAAVVMAIVFAKGLGTGNRELPTGDKDKPTPGGGGGRDVPKPTGPDKPTTPDKPDKPKPTPTPDKPKPGIPKGVRTFGDVTVLPAWFKAEGNSFWISPGCDQIAEGAQFLPLFTKDTGYGFYAIEEPTLAETLATPTYESVKVNTAYGFVDFLMNVEGYVDAEAIAFRFIQEAAPMCADVPMAQWPAPLAAWHDDFAHRIQGWVNENNGGIDFGGED